MAIEERNFEVIDENMAKVLRDKSPQERLRIAFDMWNSAQSQLKFHLSSLHPDWSSEKITAEAARRLSHGSV